ITGNIVKNDPNYENAFQYGGIYVNMITDNIQFANNIVRGHQRNIHLIQGAGVTGEKTTVTIPSLPLSFSSTNIPLLGEGADYVIAGCHFMLSDDIPQTESDYVSVALKKINTETKDKTTIAVVLTNNTSLMAFERNELELGGSAKVISKNDL